MPTDTPAAGAGSRAGVSGLRHDDELIFTAQDLGRDREQVDSGGADLGFTLVPRAPLEPVGDAVDPGTAAPAPAPTGPITSAAVRDSFVIRDPQRAVPATPLDAPVTGAGTQAGAVAGAAPSAVGVRTFHIGTGPAAASAEADQRPPWLVLDAIPTPGPTASRQGWTTRHSALAGRSAEATMLRLREEAVDLSWKSAWTAVAAADTGRRRRRR